MIILIGNQKGGTGKSTVTLLLANYLSSERKKKVAILDMSFQKTVYIKAEKAKVLENNPLYDVITSHPDTFKENVDQLYALRIEFILVDLPTEMDDDRLLHVLSLASMVICPFAYDESTVESTILFAIIVGKLSKRAPFIFVPNRIKNSVRYELRDEIDAVLRRLGSVAPTIPDRVDFLRINTIYTPEETRSIISPLLDLLYEQYLREFR